MKSKLTIIILTISIVLINQYTWALQIVSPKEGDTVYAGDDMTIVVKPDPGENWVAVFFGFDAMTYNPTLDEYTITIQVPKDYFGYYDNLIIVANDNSGGSIKLRGRIFVKMPPNVVLQSIMLGNELIVLRKLPPENSLVDAEKIETRQLGVAGIYSDGIQRYITPSASGTIYTSSDETVATVDADGKVTAQGLGEAKITVENGEYSATVDVIVKPYK